MQKIPDLDLDIALAAIVAEREAAVKEAKVDLPDLGFDAVVNDIAKKRAQAGACAHPDVCTCGKCRPVDS